jgi:hypothetical protein
VEFATPIAADVLGRHEAILPKKILRRQHLAVRIFRG